MFTYFIRSLFFSVIFAMDTSTSVDCNSYFNYLPDEILLKILEQLTTLDVINFCKCYNRYAYLYGEKNILSCINLSKRNGFNRSYSFSTIMKNVCPDIVTVLNITNVYWIAASEIRKCLKKLVNLEELYLIGTKVGISKTDSLSYKSKKLKKLAVTIDDKELQDSHAQYFPNVESLCVQIISKKDFTCQYRLQCLIKKLKQLSELWIHDVTNSYPLDYDHLAYTGSNLKIFAFKALCSMFSDLKFKGLTKIFISEKSGREAYYEKLESKSPDPRTLAASPAWKVLNELHTSVPFGLSDAKKLHYGLTNINKIEFEELNFMHYPNLCCPRYINAIKEIICSNNSKKLQKLALTNCLVTDKRLANSEENPKKKKKYDHNEPLSEEHKKFVDNLANLKKLELYTCCRYEGFRIYYFIQYLKNLTHLTLEIPASLNGVFIKKVFENCNYLETLKVNVVLSNESFNQDFWMSLSLAKNLKNLRYEVYRISLENIFFGLAAMTKMERLFIKCKYVDNFGVVYLKKFLEANPNLELMVIIINTATETMLKTLTKNMKVCKDRNKMFFAKKDERIFTEGFPIPELHYYDLISPHTHVSNLNITDKFHNR
ncbi:uncharacterized protein LOC123677059 [Harmonia axyridis]|uniref:uncharacterized protein LOC123677059 n=1 Tax=Harmonia axyridis TaxID=115357 RepID=UPI001E2786C4|nr:uncharacterized protein LOC123677059 [Harmonia axyridis]